MCAGLNRHGVGAPLAKVQSNLQRAPRVAESPGQRDGWHGAHRGLGPSRHLLGDPGGSRQRLRIHMDPHGSHMDPQIQMSRNCQDMSHDVASVAQVKLEAAEYEARRRRELEEAMRRATGALGLTFPILKCMGENMHFLRGALWKKVGEHLEAT